MRFYFLSKYIRSLQVLYKLSEETSPFQLQLFLFNSSLNWTGFSQFGRRIKFLPFYKLDMLTEFSLISTMVYTRESSFSMLGMELPKAPLCTNSPTNYCSTCVHIRIGLYSSLLFNQ